MCKEPGRQEKMTEKFEIALKFCSTETKQRGK